MEEITKATNIKVIEESKKEIKRIVKTRFAPSPTGIMHFGNVRTALFNYLFAKHNEGEFILRIEDTDQERSKKEYISSIFDSLTVLGLNWDGSVVYQSERLSIYEKLYKVLLDRRLIYRCFCSEEKLSLMRKIQLSQGLPPRYTGFCLKLKETEIRKRISNQEPFCWRFKVPKNTTIEFTDLIKGKQKFNSSDFSDFIIRRQDSTAPFMFCNAVDDALQGVTHALRGEDHLTNTPRQLLLLQVLGLLPPQYGHFPLINDIDGLKLSKRGGSVPIRDLLMEGYLPEALLNYLARLGHNYDIKDNHVLNQILSLEQLAVNFNINNISLNPARHDQTHLHFWQKQSMLLISEDQLLNILKENIDFNNIFENNNHKLVDFLHLIKTNITMPQEAIMWAEAFFTDNFYDLKLSADAKEILQNININFLKTIITCMETNNNFSDLCEELKKLGFTGKNLFINLRVLFTGQTYGAELNKIFDLVGTQRIKNRATQILQNTANI